MPSRESEGIACEESGKLAAKKQIFFSVTVLDEEQSLFVRRL